MALEPSLENHHRCVGLVTELGASLRLAKKKKALNKSNFNKSTSVQSAMAVELKLLNRVLPAEVMGRLKKKKLF